MARVLNTQIISTPISKLVELPSSYIVNGQFYNKVDMSPSPLDFGFYESSNKCEMIINQSAFSGCDLAGKTTNGAVPDSSNSNISYCVKPGIYNHTDGYTYVIFYKTEKYGNDVKIKSYRWKGDRASRQCFGNIIDQDDSYLYVTITCEDYKTLIFKLNKETMAESGTYEFGANKYVSVVRSTDMYIYLAVTGASNYFVITKYNKVAGTATIIKDDTGASGGYSSQCIIAKHPANPNVFYAVRDGFMTNSLHYSIIRQYILDINTDTVGTTNLDMDLFGLSFGASIPTIDNKVNVMNELFTFTDNNKTFMAYVRYGEGVTISNSFMLVFEFISDNEIKLIQETKFSPIIFTMCLPANNNKTLMLANNGQVRFYSWNSYSKKFENTSTVVKAISVVGCDIDGNILIQYEDSSVDMFSEVMAINVSANLESEEYEYNGVDIASNVIVYAQNYNGEFVSTNVKLTLIGPAVFTATNDNVLTLATSTMSPNILPITIKDSGYVRVTVEML